MLSGVKQRMVDSFDENVIEGSNTENAYCEALYNTVPCALFTVDKEYKITCWNKRAEKITGYLAEDVLGKDCSLFEIDSCFTGDELVFDGAIMPVIDKVCTIKDKQGNILTISAMPRRGRSPCQETESHAQKR